jgi:hypothetical protein
MKMPVNDHHHIKVSKPSIMKIKTFMKISTSSIDQGRGYDRQLPTVNQRKPVLQEQCIMISNLLTIKGIIPSRILWLLNSLLRRIYHPAIQTVYLAILKSLH